MLVLPKKDAAVHLTVSEEEIHQVLAACEQQRTPKQIAQALGLVSGFVYCGLRWQE